MQAGAAQAVFDWTLTFVVCLFSSFLCRYERELRKLRQELQRRSKQLVDKRSLLEVRKIGHHSIALNACARKQQRKVAI